MHRGAHWAVLIFACALARGADGSLPPLARSGLNTRWLSGGLYSALAAQGALGADAVHIRARDTTTPDLSKGKPPAVLDARVGVNVRLGDDPAALPATQRGQAEPHIARSAATPDVLLATFQEGRYTSGGGAIDCGYALSRDGGLSWTRALIPQLTTASGGRFLRATDPVAAFGPQGDLYLETLASTDNSFGIGAVVVSRSSDGGATWSAPATVFQTPSTQTMPDKEWLAVNDFPTAPNSGRLVATWTNFTFAANGTSTGNNLLASVSDDRGATWSAPVAITPAGSLNQGSLPLFLPDGSLAVIYITFANANTETVFTINCKRSTDGGRTFPAAATTAVPLVLGYSDPDLRSGVFLPAAAVARTTGEIFVTYTALVADAPRVMVTKSADQGATWTTPVVASDNPANSAVVNPAIAVTPDGKTVATVFIDKRLTPTDASGHNFFIDHFAALSFDGGATWQPNIRLSEMTSDIRYAALTSQGYMLGDYLGIAAPSDQTTFFRQNFVPIWCDTRTGDADPFSVRIAPSAVADVAAWQTARNAFGLAQLDDDHDGTSDFLEYVDGSDPLRNESGEALFIRRLAADVVDILWTQRPAGNPLSQVGGFFATTIIKPIDPNLGLLASLDANPGNVTSVPLTADQFPTVRIRDGLVWAGVRTSGFKNNVQGVLRAVVVGPGRFAIGEPAAAFNTDSRLINLSTRGQVGTGANQLIVGFVIEGGAKTVLLRAAGPALAQLGLSGTLADPRLELIYGSLGQLQVFSATNDDWNLNAPGVDAALFTRLGAFPFASGSKDSAIVQTLPARSYTAVVSGANGGTGLGLVEVYDADAAPGAPANPRLLNLSTRGAVGVGGDALIAGFVISGTQPRRVLLRAVGPSLAQFGVPGVLADPLLTLYDSAGKIVATNDDWEISRSSAALAATAQLLGAFALNPASLDSALLITLPPGAYTAVITGVNGATGTALVEIYDAN